MVASCAVTAAAIMVVVVALLHVPLQLMFYENILQTSCTIEFNFIHLRYENCLAF